MRSDHLIGRLLLALFVLVKNHLRPAVSRRLGPSRISTLAVHDLRGRRLSVRPYCVREDRSDSTPHPAAGERTTSAANVVVIGGEAFDVTLPLSSSPQKRPDADGT